MLDRVDGALDRWLRHAVGIEKRRMRIAPVETVLRVLPFVLCVLAGGYRTLKQQMSPDELLTFIYLINFVVQPAVMMPQLVVRFRQTSASWDRIAELLNEPEERTGGNAGTVAGPPLVLENVRFSYDGETMAIGNFSHAFQEGKIYAVVGESGSGKSTLFKLLTGLYEYECGSILLFGKRLDELSLEEIRFAFNQWSRFVAGLQLSLAAASRIRELTDAPAEDVAGGPEPRAPRRDVAFAGVSFSYDGHHPVLRGVDIEIEEGSTVAFVGPSGSGKSTIAKLLLGLYRDYEGSIRICGRELRDWPLRSLRESIAFAPQHPYLFEGTIEDNIRAGNRRASVEEVLRAARMAQILDFIEQLPDGLRTRVTENGQWLSGGQKQRIALARVFLKNAPIIVLDEPMSALDTFTEDMFQDALKALSPGKTIVIIAHRLSTVEHADRIYVLHEGRIAESGTHASLLGRNDLYARLRAGSPLTPVS